MTPADNDHAPGNKPHRSRAAESIHRRLVGLVRALLTRDRPDALDGLPDEIELQLRVPVRLDGNKLSDSQDFASALLAQVDSLRIQGETEALGHRSGHAPCYWCNAPICEHSMPPDHHSVLIGWSPTGVPLWKNLTSVLIEAKDEQIDFLYGESPGPVVIWQSEADLLGDVLPEYLNDSLFAHPVGALLSGGFTLPMPDSDPDLLSITALVLESRAGRDIPRYSLNLISNTPPPHHLASLVGSGTRSILSRWISSLRSSLNQLQHRLISQSKDGKRSSLQSSRELVVEALIESRAHLKTLRRRSERRTQHAEERSDDPDRPTSAAISDLMACDPKDLFHDRKESTIVVRGSQGRVHIFTVNGRHITSASYSSEAIQSRIARGRWRPMEEGKAGSFLEQIYKKIPPRDGDSAVSDAS